MKKLNFPSYQFKIKSENNRKQIFDDIRKKYVRLTPEEWVRQHLAKHLIIEKKYPAGLIAIEAGLNYNGLKKRSDLVAYNNQGKPILIAECKAPNIKLTQSTFDQAAIYNMSLKVNYLLITNGLEHYCCSIDHKKKEFYFLSEIPIYKNQ